MKLAEALLIRADLQIKAGQLQERLIANAKIQDGEKPAENPENLFVELNACINRLEKLIKNIYNTNAATVVDNKSISDYIAEKDCIAAKQKIYRAFCKEASERVSRYSQKEIRISSTLDVETLQKEIDKLAKKYRELDTKLQSINWTTDLLE